MESTVYECIVCGESSKGCDLVQNRDGYLVCPFCGSEDLIVIWDAENPPESVEDFGLVRAE